MKRTYTDVGKGQGYTGQEIDRAISKVKWVKFTPENLPMSQGLCLKAVISQCKIPFSKISWMEIHGGIKNFHSFYALDVKYVNGQARIYIADDGANSCVVATDFAADKK